MSIKAIAMALAIMATSPALAGGFCSGMRVCFFTINDMAASKVWQTCLYKSAGMQKTDDPGAALEAAFAACTKEEKAMLSLVQTESPHLTAAEAESLRTELRAQVKAEMLGIQGLINPPLGP